MQIKICLTQKLEQKICCLSHALCVGAMAGKGVELYLSI